MEIRPAQPSDYDKVVTVLDDWWGGRQVTAMLPRLFFQHFSETSFVAVENSSVVGFLVGFVSPSDPSLAYVHFIGIAPNCRRHGMGRALYQRFFDEARKRGCFSVRCVTSSINANSVAFHRQIGFEVEHSDHEVNGIPCHLNYDGPDEHRVLFRKRLDCS